MTAEGAPGPEVTEIETRIIGFIESELLAPGTGLGRHDDLLSGELLDSVAVLRLAAFVEEELGTSMGPADFVIENFRNVAVLAEYVLRSRRPSG